MLILASNSPRRQELLTMLGYTFEVRPSDCDESSNIRNPRKLVEELSKRKAKTVICNSDDVVIGSDTVVAIGRDILGKPKDELDAVNMLQKLSGRTHNVHTGVTIIKDKTVITKSISCKVKFRRLSKKEILDYVSTGEPMDKAGAYGIQGKASAFIPKINGDYFSVVGFPCCFVDKTLQFLEIDKK